MKAIDSNWEFINDQIDKIFAGIKTVSKNIKSNYLDMKREKITKEELPQLIQETVNKYKIIKQKREEKK